jgi:hypothetical protein
LHGWRLSNDLSRLVSAKTVPAALQIFPGVLTGFSESSPINSLLIQFSGAETRLNFQEIKPVAAGKYAHINSKATIAA